MKNKIYKICKDILKITEEEITEVRKVYEDQLNYVHPLKMATVKSQHDLGRYNQKVIYQLLELKTILEVGPDRMQPEEKQTCEYKLYHPSEDGYPEIKGYFYECSECGAGYIDIETADEYEFCPHCARKIVSRETMSCINCKGSEWDGDCWRCENPKGKNMYENIEDACFCGCQEFEYEDKHLEN